MQLFYHLLYREQRRKDCAEYYKEFYLDADVPAYKVKVSYNAPKFLHLFSYMLTGMNLFYFVALPHQVQYSILNMYIAALVWVAANLLLINWPFYQWFQLPVCLKVEDELPSILSVFLIWPIFVLFQLADGAYRLLSRRE